MLSSSSCISPGLSVAARSNQSNDTARGAGDELARLQTTSRVHLEPLAVPSVFWKLLHSRYRLDKSIKSRPGTDRHELLLSGSRTERRLVCVHVCGLTAEKRATRRLGVKRANGELQCDASLSVAARLCVSTTRAASCSARERRLTEYRWEAKELD
ncbi:hypothetical protein AOLI_G00174480 [Acnodon oligacanthus]